MPARPRWVESRPGSALSGARAALVLRAGPQAKGTGTLLDMMNSVPDPVDSSSLAGESARGQPRSGSTGKFTLAMGKDGAGYDTLSARQIQLGKFTPTALSALQAGLPKRFLFSGLVQAKKKMSRFATMLPCCTQALAYLL